MAIPRQRNRRGALYVEEEVDFGVARIMPDRDRRGGWTLLLDGAPQSYVDIDDPKYLHFEYVRRLGQVIDAAAPAGAPVHVLHLGGGALTLPRYIAATRPGSRQRVAEHDAALTTLIRELMPLPRQADIRVRAIDARTAAESYAEDSFDLVIADVYRDTQMPRSLASVEFASHVARILYADGIFAVNVADLPPATFTRTYIATMRAAFGEVCVIATPEMLGGKRHGNAIVVAAPRAGRLPLAELVVASRKLSTPVELVHGAELDRFVGGARAMSDSTAQDSPKPPPALFV